MTLDQVRDRKKRGLSGIDLRYHAMKNSSVVTSSCSFQGEVRGRTEKRSSFISYSLSIAPR